ncbi:MAG: hypothetical protein ABI333_24965 [bacterium]
MAEKPSTTMIPRVLGIAMIVFAGLGIAFTAASLTKLGTLAGIQVSAVHVGPLRTFQLVSAVTGLVVDGLELSAGVFAVTYRQWAPRLSAVYCAAALLRVAALVMLYFGTVAPIVKTLGSELARGYGFGVVFRHCILLAWIVLVIALMQRKNVRQACNH